jgi:hypothetical protein
MHWDGSEWTSVPTPGGIYYLKGIDARATDDVWAVGDQGNCQVCFEAVVIHWDGISWTKSDSLRVRGALYLNDVVAIAPDDVWAVGMDILHWDGAAWTVAARPQIELYGISAAAPDDIWAVGRGRANAPLLMHWDGRTWGEVPIPIALPIAGRWLHDVTAISANDLWVVTQGNGILHWDGKTWANLADPAAVDYRVYVAITHVNGAVWIAGYESKSWTNASPHKSAILRYANPTGIACGAPPPWRRVPLTPPGPVPGTGSLTFPETGKIITGVFLDYWKNNGGLAQQGYPISSPMGEMSDQNGKVYTVQYFERAVFEYHPEFAGTRNEVLLTQLGRFQYNRKYSGREPAQQPNTELDSVLFAETGKRLGGRFLKYWQEHGGLAQQGLPISDEFTEVSDVNGKPYVVQYFERAVFEYHPENSPPYDVLLSLLGSLRYEQMYGAHPSAE